MKTILVVGAGFLQCFAIRRAKELGYHVLAVDGNPDAEGFSIADEHQIINIVDQEACLAYAMEKCVDGVMTAATDYGVLTAAYIAQEMGLAGLNYQSALRIKNKYEVRKCLYEHQVDDTQQAFEVTEQTDIQTLAQMIQYPVMVKPCDGSGSRGASKVEDISQFGIACQMAMANSLTHRAEVETFIDGQEYGVESIVENGQIHILAVMKKWMTQPPYYAELGHGLPSGLEAELEGKIRTCVSRAIEALEINFGAVNMDLLVTQDKMVHIVDVGARMGGNLIGSHIVPLGTGVDYLGNLIRATLGDPVDITPCAAPQNVATRLLALTPGKVKVVPDMDEICQECQVSVFHHLHEGDTIQEYHTNLDGCGYVVAVGESVEAAAEKAECGKKMIDKRIVRG